MKNRFISLIRTSNIRNIFSKWKWYDWLFLVLVVSSLASRLINYSIELGISGGDIGRDFLIASEIIGANPLGLNELPLSGPLNNFGLINSPVYYYFLSAFLLLNSSLFFINLVNIVLQVLTIIFIYFVARSVFGGLVGLMTSLLFSFDLMIMRQSLHIWQPYIMQPFLYLSYLLIYLGWKKGSSRYLYLSIFFAVFAGALHNSAFAVFPLLLAMILLILKNQNSDKWVYVGLIVITIASFLIMYIAPLIFIYETHTQNSGQLNNVFRFDKFQQNLSGSVQTLPRNTPRLHWKGFNNTNYQWLFFLFLFSSIFFLNNKDRKFWVLLFTGLLSLMPFIVLTLLGQEWPQPNHYTALAAGTMYLFIVGAVCSLFDIERHQWRRNLFILLMLGALLLVPNQLVEFRDKIFGAPDLQEQAQTASEQISNRVLILKEQKGFDNLNFFTLRGVHGTGPGAGHMHEASFWLALEDILDQKFTYITRDGFFETINNNQYIFLICVSNQYSYGDQHDCREEYYNNIYRFSSEDERDRYDFDEIVYSDGPLTIFIGELGEIEMQ